MSRLSLGSRNGLLLLPIVLLPAVVAAERVPLSPAKLRAEATHVVTGVVRGVYEREVKTERYGRGTVETEYLVEITVGNVEKGTGLSPGNLVYARCWKLEKRGARGLSPGPSGHTGVPAGGDRVRAFLVRGRYPATGQEDDGYAAVYPNGFERLGDLDEAALKRLRGALTFHAPFDGGVDAAFARGDGRLHTTPSGKPADAKPGLARDDVRIAPGEGVHGDALRFEKKSSAAVLYRAKGNVQYRERGWSGTVSMWLRLDPERDLEPGYCDPIQITDKKWNDASFFVDFTKDNPRDFRLGVFSDLAVWNPDGREWEAIPESERPMVTVKKHPFRSDRWVHVAFTFSGFNDGESGERKAATARLYLNGAPQGEITGKPQVFTWDPERTVIYLGLSYVGLFDDLAVFNRALEPAEIAALSTLPGGVAALSRAE